MKTIAELKAEFETATGKKVSVKKIKRGSMKGYVMFSIKKEKGEYLHFDWNAVQEFKAANRGNETNPTFVSTRNVEVFVGNQVYN